MKKYIISVAVAAALIVAGGYGVKSSLNPQLHLSDLAKANVEALACKEYCGNESIGHLWCRIDEDCPYQIWVQANATITFLGMTITGGSADGYVEVNIPKGSTRCQWGGWQQCTERYCPAPWG